MAKELCNTQNIGLKDVDITEYVLPTRIVDEMKASHPGYKMRKVYVYLCYIYYLYRKY